MPYKEKEIHKRYYTMAEVVAMFGANASQIRFYEQEFEILKPKKSKQGHRMFSLEDIENLKVIFHLLKDKGFTIQGAKEQLKNSGKELKNRQRIIDSLEKIKDFLIAVHKQL